MWSTAYNCGHVLLQEEWPAIDAHPCAGAAVRGIIGKHEVVTEHWHHLCSVEKPED